MEWIMFALVRKTSVRQALGRRIERSMPNFAVGRRYRWKRADLDVRAACESLISTLLVQSNGPLSLRELAALSYASIICNNPDPDDATHRAVERARRVLPAEAFFYLGCRAFHVRLMLDTVIQQVQGDGPGPIRWTFKDFLVPE